MENSLTPQSLDALKEILNIGAAHAATALSKLVGSRVNISLPSVTLDSIENIPVFMGETEDVESMVVTRCDGEAPGVFVLSFPEESGNILLEHLHKTSPENGVLAEVGNILAGSYLGVLQKFLHMEIPHALPSSATDMVGALLSSILCDFGEQTDNILAGLVEIDVPKLQVKGRLFLLFTPDSTQTILTLANKKLL